MTVLFPSLRAHLTPLLLLLTLAGHPAWADMASKAGAVHKVKPAASAALADPAKQAKDLPAVGTPKSANANAKGDDVQYPGVAPRPPQPPRKPGDLQEKLGNKAVAP